MDLKIECASCMHSNVCKNKEILEGFVSHPDIKSALKQLSHLDWVDLKMNCSHYYTSSNRRVGSYD